MFFRFRKPTLPAVPPTDAALSLSGGDTPAQQGTDWVPDAQPADAAAQTPGVELGRNPHKGKALESVRGSHR